MDIYETVMDSILSLVVDIVDYVAALIRSLLP